MKFSCSCVWPSYIIYQPIVTNDIVMILSFKFFINTDTKSDILLPTLFFRFNTFFNWDYTIEDDDESEKYKRILIIYYFYCDHYFHHYFYLLRDKNSDENSHHSKNYNLDRPIKDYCGVFIIWCWILLVKGNQKNSTSDYEHTPI
jgi:hypothetical protein